MPAASMHANQLDAPHVASKMQLYVFLCTSVLALASCAVKSNDMMLAVYLSSLIRSILALHKLIDNKEQRIAAEKEAIKVKEAKDKAKAAAEVKEKEKKEEKKEAAE